MGIFDRLKNAILGSNLRVGPGATGTSAQASPAPPPSQSSGATQQASATREPPGSSTNPPVDIESVLNQMAAQKHEKLNWQSSIVDLMKVVDLDPSLDNRKALAKELGYDGNTQDSASMNVWLHKEVMQKLAASGGKVPDSLRH